MADNKSKTGAADRAKVAASQPYEVAYLAKKHNVSQQKVIDAVKKAGVSRTAVEKELKKGK